MENVDMAVVYKDTLEVIRKKRPRHAIFRLTPKEQVEFMDLIRQGQGYYIKQGVLDKIPQITLPGLGTFMFNPLRALVERVKAANRDTLYPYELKQLIKEKLADYYKTNRDPFVTKTAKVRLVDFENGTIEII